MAEIGIDISREIPKRLTTDQVHEADIVITMGCGDACPVYPGKRYLDWDLPDPAGLDLQAVRPIRDEIERRVRALLYRADKVTTNRASARSSRPSSGSARS
jgi:protein-tyrosine-phosphatase